MKTQETEPTLAEELLTLANDSTLDPDGWALIAPFGEWPKTRVYREDGQVKEQKFLQVVDNEAADSLMSREHSLFGRLKRAVVGIPLYQGHGDLKDMDPQALANEHRKIKLGVVDQVRKSSRGIEAHFALDNDGATAVAAGYKFPSSFWWVKASGQRGDAIVARPIKLISVALTQFPNISGVESLANSRDAGGSSSLSTTPPMTKLVGYLIGKGLQVPESATEDTIVQALENGDHTGHAFLGNQYAGGEAEGSHYAASKKAHNASMAANDKASHEKAAAAHLRAAAAHDQAGNTDTVAYHQAAAHFHANLASKTKK